MSDLIERLRVLLRCRCEPDAACCEACSAVDAVEDEIERRRTDIQILSVCHIRQGQEIERLREAAAFGVEYQKALEDTRRELAEAQTKIQTLEGQVAHWQEMYQVMRGRGYTVAD